MRSFTFWMELIWQGFIGAAFACLGFGVLFNIRGKDLLMAGLIGGIGGFVYQFCTTFGMQEAIANFLAAIALSFCAEIAARKMKTTVSTFTACALIPLVPGGTAYEMMVEFSRGHAMAGILRGLDLVSVSGMLAMGILTVSTLTRFFFYSRRMMKKPKAFFYEMTHPARKRKSKRFQFTKESVRKKKAKEARARKAGQNQKTEHKVEEHTNEEKKKNGENLPS